MGREIGLGHVTHQLEIAAEDWQFVTQRGFQNKDTTNNLDHYHN